VRITDDDSDVRKIEVRFDLSFDPPADSSCLMPRMAEPLSLGTLKDDLPIYLYVAVTDTGPGLTAKELELLFQRFSQVSRESTRKYRICFRGSDVGFSQDSYHLWRIRFRAICMPK
jgi:signal transduction histidine kinase